MIDRLLRIFATICILSASNVCFGKYVQTCKVKYRNQDGWSKLYEIQVTFMSGKELNEATETYEYSTYDSYAMIFWSEEQVSIIELDNNKCQSIMTGTSDCEYDDFHTMMDSGEIDGTDQNDKKWSICYGSFRCN